MVKNNEFSMIIYRRLIAVIDWVDIFSKMTGGLSTKDKFYLIKYGLAPLALFKAASSTAVVTNNENILCLCNHAYVPKNITKAYKDT